jgi:hypothetical protein
MLRTHSRVRRRQANQPFQGSLKQRRRRCFGPLNGGVRRLVAALAVTRAPGMQALVPDPPSQKWRKALSFSGGHAMRKPRESSEADSPAAAEISTERDSLATGASLMAETDTRSKSSTCGGAPSWFARLNQAPWDAKGVRGGSAERLLPFEV